jgi:lysophospholipase L1-like esterase
MQRVAFAILASFLLLGASTAPRATAIEPSRADPEAWRNEMAEFEKLDADKRPAPGSIVFVGSSSIRMWDVAKSFPELPVLNRGFGGSQICDSTLHADLLVIRHRPRVIVFYAGDNDINSGKSAEQVHIDFRTFVAAVRKKLPVTPIAYIAIKPSIARWHLREAMQEANRLIAAGCEEDDTLEFVDVWPAMLGEVGTPRKELFLEDGLHLNAKGYELWTDLVRPFVKTTL